jgi:hypothetical protein
MDYSFECNLDEKHAYANESLAKTIKTHSLFSQIGLETIDYLIIVYVKVMPKQIIY